jgi:hypothetical protein
MLRGFLCASIVAAFSLSAAAAAVISEDVPVPGGTAAFVRAIGIRAAPDRSRFVAEVARLIYEAPERLRQDPASPISRLIAHLDAVTRFQRAYAAVQSNGAVSLADAASGAARRRLGDLLAVVGLRLRESRGAYAVETDDAGDVVQRVALLANLGVDVSGLAALLNRGEAATIRLPTELVPVPLTSAVWSEVIFDRPVPPDELFGAIVADERAALLCHGLASLDDLTLQYLVEHPATLRQLYAHAEVFGAFGSHLKIREGRIVTPGEERGAAARGIWETLSGARVTDPSRFVTELFGRDRGRLAYLYDTIGELDPPRAAFALSLWIADPAARDERVQTLAAAIGVAYPEWPTAERPFIRPLHDLGSLLNSVDVNADGRPKEPAGRRLWERAFESQELPIDAERQLRDYDRDGPIDAGWVAQAIAATDVRTRGQRLMQIAFGYRMFGGTDAASRADLLVALRAFPVYRTVMLGLEQMGVRRPSVYAAAARQAAALARLDGGRAFVAFSQFQGALAVIVRLAAVGSIDAAGIERLVTSLAAVPLKDDGRLDGGISAWLRREVLNGHAGDGAEHALIVALAGPTLQPPRIVDWEGGRYRLDLAAAEERRLRRVRERQAGYSLDAALQLESIALLLRGEALDLEGVKSAAAALERTQTMLPAAEPVSASEFVPGGATDVGRPREIADRALRDLSRITRPRDTRRAVEISADLLEAADVVLGEVLSSFAYALNLGDPDGATLLGGDVARRHDFGIGSRVPDVRVYQPWAIPEQHYDPGVPWHVAGSLIGLDVALAPLALQRLAGDGLSGPPVLGSNDRETFARSIALLNPYALRDAERDRIGAAIARGRQRASQARADTELDALAEAVRMDGWRRRALQWTVAREPERALLFLSLAELFVLGGGDLADLHRWGTAMTPIWGCLCTRMPAPNAWRFVTGRPQVGVLGSAVGDVMLHVAVSLDELDLPAPLARSVASAAMQQFLDTVTPNDGNDWLALVRGAQTISRERIEDFVAAAAAVGGPLVPAAAPALREPR